jgi:hypothetical protein
MGQCQNSSAMQRLACGFAVLAAVPAVALATVTWRRWACDVAWAWSPFAGPAFLVALVAVLSCVGLVTVLSCIADAMHAAIGNAIQSSAAPSGPRRTGCLRRRRMAPLAPPAVVDPPSSTTSSKPPSSSTHAADEEHFATPPASTASPSARSTPASSPRSTPTPVPPPVPTVPPTPTGCGPTAGPTWTPAPSYPTPPPCPSCGAATVFRANKRSGYFFGCSGFRADGCRGTHSLRDVQLGLC